MTPQITLDAWRCATFAEPSRPTMCTVRRWAMTGRISPQPTKCGRTYYCDPAARYTDPRMPTPAAKPIRLVDRIRAAEATQA